MTDPGRIVENAEELLPPAVELPVGITPFPPVGVKEGVELEVQPLDLDPARERDQEELPRTSSLFLSRVYCSGLDNCSVRRLASSFRCQHIKNPFHVCHIA